MAALGSTQSTFNHSMSTLSTLSRSPSLPGNFPAGKPLPPAPWSGPPPHGESSAPPLRQITRSQIVDLRHISPAQIQAANHAPPLHAAARCGDLVKLRALLSQGVDVDDIDLAGETALHTAAKNRQVAAAAALLDGGAFTCVRDREFDVPRDDVWTLNQEVLALRIDWVDKKSGEGKTPIYHLRIRDCFEAVMERVLPRTKRRVIQELCEEIFLRNEVHALHFAGSRNFTDLAQFICSMKHTAMMKIEPPEPKKPFWMFDRELPPMLARNTRHRQWVPSVVDPVTPDGLEKTPLFSAAVCGRIEMARLLIDQKASVKASDVDLRTPLHAASSSGWTELARLLLDNHANVDQRSLRGQTPLHEAAFYGHFGTSQLLLERDADPRSFAMDGTDPEKCDKRPFELARQNKHFAVASLLEKAARGT